MDGSDLSEFADNMRRLAPIDILTIVDPRADAISGPTDKFLASVPAGRELKSLKPLLDEYLTAPERKKGTATVTTLDSLVELANREKGTNSVLFAQNSESAPSLLAVLNFHEAGADADAHFGDYRVSYGFPVSKEWKAWTGKNAGRMGQADFADFLENRILDVLDPPDADKPEDQALIQLQAKLGGIFAGPTKLLELSRGMTVNLGGTVEQIVNLSSGEVSVQFKETHLDGKGAPLKVPSLFLIGIPVFDGGALYRLAVRLRYRKDGAALVWFYEIHRADRAFDDAFKEACERAQLATSLPLFYGKPAA
jgi:uncharacterized protein YfdQ (DUF2303 family)